MTRSSEQVGPNVEQALASAIGDLLGRDVDDVRVDITADGLDALPAPVRVHLRLEEIEAADAPADDGSPSEDTEAVGDADASTEVPTDDDGGSVDGGTPAEPATNDPSTSDRPQGVTDADIDAEADAAADFLEGLLDALDLPGDLRINVREDHAEIELVDIGSGALIGRRGQTLEAIQELVRCSLQREFQRRSRVMVDAEGYRARRLEKLLEKADEAIDQVLDSGEPERLEPMDVFERKAVHHLVAEVEGVESRSQGREPSRRIVIEPA